MWFGKFDEFFIFHDTFFPLTRKIHDIKEGSCFLNRGTRTKFFLAVKVTNNVNMIRISFFLKAVILLLSWCKILFSNINWIQLLWFVSVICVFSFGALIYWGLFYNYWTLFKISVLLKIIKNYIVASHIIQNTYLVWSYSLCLFLFCR